MPVGEQVQFLLNAFHQAAASLQRTAQIQNQLEVSRAQLEQNRAAFEARVRQEEITTRLRQEELQLQRQKFEVEQSFFNQFGKTEDFLGAMETMLENRALRSMDKDPEVGSAVDEIESVATLRKMITSATSAVNQARNQAALIGGDFAARLANEARDFTQLDKLKRANERIIALVSPQMAELRLRIPGMAQEKAQQAAPARPSDAPAPQLSAPETQQPAPAQPGGSDSGLAAISEPEELTIVHVQQITQGNRAAALDVARTLDFSSDSAARTSTARLVRQLASLGLNREQSTVVLRRVLAEAEELKDDG